MLRRAHTSNYHQLRRARLPTRPCQRWVPLVIKRILRPLWQFNCIRNAACTNGRKIEVRNLPENQRTDKWLREAGRPRGSAKSGRSGRRESRRRGKARIIIGARQVQGGGSPEDFLNKRRTRRFTTESKYDCLRAMPLCRSRVVYHQLAVACFSILIIIST